MTASPAALLDQTRTFAREVVAPGALVWERERRLGHEALSQAAGMGLTGLQVPPSDGGLGHPYSVKAQVAEILGGADFGFAMSLLNTQNVAHRLTRDAPGLVPRYLDDLLTARRVGCTALTEPGAGSDFGAIRTTAAADGDGWRLNGEKAWIINAVAADLIVVYAQTQPGSGGRGIASFLVDGQRDGFTRTDPARMSAQHSIGAGGFILNDYRVEPGEMIRPAGEAFKSALTDINGARAYVAAMCCGMVAECLGIVAEYGNRRETFSKPLIGHQGWRWKLADADTDLAAARALVRDAAALIDAEKDAMYPAARAKVFATRMAERHLPALAQCMGAEGLKESYPFGRHMIGVRAGSFTDGSTEILLERLAAQFRA
ncbi:MAG: acyl-CoA dehydrogenase family protein [Pseudomonadota bacterium]